MSVYAHLKRLLPPLDNPVVLEIGAHIGTDTQRLVELLKPPYFYLAFEPDPRNYAQLLKLRAGGLDFVALEFAIADVDNSLPFYQSHGYGPDMQREFTDGGSLKRPKDNVRLRPWISFTRTTVEARRLDTVCGVLAIDRVDFVWMDVQGAELEVIRGGLETLARTRYLYTECQEGRYHGQPGFDGIVAVLPGAWRVVFRTKTDTLLERKEN